MRFRTRIKEEAARRGMTMKRLAQRIGEYPSNLSLMDRGKRAFSMNKILKIAHVLGCPPMELLTFSEDPYISVYSDKKLNQWIAEKAKRNTSGSDKTWVHQTVLAWRMHFQHKKRLNEK